MDSGRKKDDVWISDSFPLNSWKINHLFLFIYLLNNVSNRLLSFKSKCRCINVHAKRCVFMALYDFLSLVEISHFWTINIPLFVHVISSIHTSSLRRSLAVSTCSKSSPVCHVSVKFSRLAVLIMCPQNLNLSFFDCMFPCCFYVH